MICRTNSGTLGNLRAFVSFSKAASISVVMATMTFSIAMLTAIHSNLYQVIHSIPLCAYGYPTHGDGPPAREGC